MKASSFYLDIFTAAEGKEISIKEKDHAMGHIT